MIDHADERDPLEALAEEFIERRRNGECPTVEEYAAEQPDLAEEIRALFPTIANLEGLKVRNEQSSDGRATIGPARVWLPPMPPDCAPS